MTAPPDALCRLDNAVIAVSGADRLTFLQGLTTNDVSRIGNDHAIYSTLLTPQGKFLFDFHIAEADGTWLLETQAHRADELVRRLGIFRLRVDVALEKRDGWAVLALTGPDAASLLDLQPQAGAARPIAGGAAFVDPRLADLGVRIVVPEDAVPEIEALTGLAVCGDVTAYHRLRVALGVPEAGIDLALEKSTVLEANLHRLNGVSWSKGCYMGQELTARTYYRGLLKRRLFAVSLSGGTPASGTEITRDGSVVGELRSVAGDRAIAHLKIADAEAAETLRAGDALVRVDEPAWMSPGAASQDLSQKA
ncbi:MAG: folate-binding protein [Azospirillaceae bacterium]